VNGLVGRKLAEDARIGCALIATLIPVIQVATIVAGFSSLTLPHVEHVADMDYGWRIPCRLCFSARSVDAGDACVVTGVGFLIHVYSVGYMARKRILALLSPT